MSCVDVVERRITLKKCRVGGRVLGRLVSIPIRLAVPGLGHTMSCFMIEKYKMLLYCSCLGGGGSAFVVAAVGSRKTQQLSRHAFEGEVHNGNDYTLFEIRKDEKYILDLSID